MVTEREELDVPTVIRCGDIVTYLWVEAKAHDRLSLSNIHYKHRLDIVLCHKIIHIKVTIATRTSNDTRTER